MSQYHPICASNDPETRLFESELQYFDFILKYQESRIYVSKTMVSLMKAKLEYMIPPPPGYTSDDVSPSHDISINELRTLMFAERANYAHLKARWGELQNVVGKQVVRLEAGKREPGRLTARRFLEMSREWVEVRRVIAGLLEENGNAEEVVDKAFRGNSTPIERTESQLAMLCIDGKRRERNSG